MSEIPASMESPEAVAAFLETSRANRDPLSVTIPRSREIYTSYILSIDQHHLHIDQLMPEIGNQLLQPCERIEFRLRHQGIDHLFYSNHIAQAVDAAGFPYHRLSLPAQIAHLEKRSSYRVQPKLADRPLVHIDVTPEQSYKARLENISDGGACLRLKGNHSALDFVDHVVGCEIQLAGLDLLSCQALVRHHYHVGIMNESRLGIEFRQLPESSSRKLHHMMMQLQRHNIRSYLGS